MATMRGPRQPSCSPSRFLLLCFLICNACTAFKPSAADFEYPLSTKLNAIPSLPSTFPSADTSHLASSLNPITLNYLRSSFGVSLPVDNPTKSFWLDTPGANPLAEVGSTGELTQEADICIIGSGITGISTAWHLSNILPDDNRSLENDEEEKEKPSIVVLEAREFCSGATGRNGGHLTRNMFYAFLSREASHNTSEAVKTYRLEQYTSESLVDFIEQRNLSEKVDLVHGGHVTLFRTSEEEREAREDYEAARRAGVDVGGDGSGDGEMGVRWIGNEELVKNYGLGSELNYTGVSFIGHNLWPAKLVTELYKDIQSANRVNATLHTKTPVTGILPLAPGPQESGLETSDNQVPLSQPSSKSRRWNLATPRGDVQCSYVIHATNAYASHLLPFMAEKGGPLDHGSSPRMEREHTIIPTRGQVGAVRASVSSAELGWLNSWDGGGGGWEYWFPRYQDTTTTDGGATANGDAKGEGSRNPLIILGGGRQFSRGRLEQGITNDSVVNPHVSKALREFLPKMFPNQFVSSDSNGEDSTDPWEMEWTGIMGFTNTGDPFVGPIGPLMEECDSASGKKCHNGNSLDGQYIAAGYSGHGMPRAYACAEAVAGMIKAEISGDQWTIPEWLPESYLTTAIS